MKLCFIIPSLQPGGMERVMSELIEQFSKDKKYELHLVLYGLTREIFYSIPTSVKIYKPHFAFNNKKRFYFTLKTIIYLRKQVKAINPSRILSFGEYWNNFVLIALFGLKYPVFVSDRCQPNKSLGVFHDFLRKRFYPRAKGVIAQTKKARAIFKSMYRHNKIKVIGNPIRRINSSKEIHRENIVLTVGRLIESKHHFELIKLFSEINNLDWKLIIVGDDALKQNNKIKLENLIKKLRMEESIILTGKRTDVDDFYRNSKIFAFTSSSEGFPNVIGEAMSAGLPVIAFDCVAGPSEMINNGENGFLISLFDYFEFSKKLNLLMENEALRKKLGENAKISIQKFSSESIYKQFEEFVIN